MAGAVVLLVTCPLRGPSYGCALRLDRTRFGALLEHARKIHRL
jgi:hypothetical protein